MESTARLRFLRIAPRKVRLVVNLVRGLSAEKAEHQLTFLNKGSSRPVLKLLQSAVANAEHNFHLKKENLFIKKITVDEGPTLKRWRARAFGRAAEIQKRSSHITLVLDEFTPHKAVKKATSAKGAKSGAKGKAAPQPVVSFDEIKHEAKGKAEAEHGPDGQSKKSFGSFKNIKDRFTRRLGSS